MKTPLFLTAIAVISFASCTKDTTEYNGFVKNSSSETIEITVVSENSLLETATVQSGETVKVAFSTENGDYEIYDCTSFFDTIYYSTGENTSSIYAENAVIGSESLVGGDGTRVHNCTVEIK